MSMKEYKLPNGATIVFYYDDYGVAKVTREAIDELMELVSSREMVVRCKDCFHYESDGGAMMICNITDTVCDDDDYCSYGECKEEEE